jgi:hypothetical protein
MNAGEVLYRKNCSSCHALIEPNRFEREKWNTYVKKYGKKLTLVEKELLLDYLTGSILPQCNCGKPLRPGKMELIY